MSSHTFHSLGVPSSFDILYRNLVDKLKWSGIRWECFYWMCQTLSFPWLRCPSQQIKAQCMFHMLTWHHYINKEPSCHKLHESCINRQDLMLGRISQNYSKPRKNNQLSDDTLHIEKTQHINYLHRSISFQRHKYPKITLVYSHNLDIKSLVTCPSWWDLHTETHSLQ